MMSSRGELLDLARHLKQERLFVSSERQHLQTLNEKVLKTVERLFHLAWIAKQQRINLDGLILSRAECSPALCCQRANALESVSFVDAYKLLGFHESLYGEFLQQMRVSPRLVAMCLVATEKIKVELMHHVVNVVTTSIYAHCVLQEDEKYVLQLLRYLMELQLATSENPRRLLRHGSCAFSRVYKTFSEGLFSAKLFLTAALHDPIMQLLMEDELFLDIDPGKAAVRFPPQERLRRFGKEGTPEYIANLQKYRSWTIAKLVNLTNRFIGGIKSNIYCFPPSLVWLVKQLYNVVMKAKKVEVREVGAMCADLVFSFFVCPAIVNPEPYSIISDTPISYIARFNLMQVAQILHVLAMAKWEEIEPKLMDLYGRFEKDCMSSLLDALLEGGVEDTPPEFGSQLQSLTRSAMLITECDLIALVSLLRSIAADCSDDEVDKKLLATLLAALPAAPPSSASPSSSGINLAASPETTSQTPPQTPGSKRNILSKVGKNRNKVHLSPLTQDLPDDRPKADLEESISPVVFVEEVLVISLNNPIVDCPGMMSEQKVLLMEQHNKQSRVRLKLENLPNEEESVASGGETQEKRTRFSLSHDQDSIGTSDNLEAISEAASNHSVSSSLELENENDNLSDMVSANVSGRGTPNVSGRDTPSSQIEGEEREERPLNFPVNTPKQNQEDIDDKFGKFDIKPLIEGDETVSMVSDTWSTDVLASDSEMQERPLDDIPIPASGFLDPQQPLFGLQQAGLLDVADTASEAWSTDVLASDSERMQDVDTDDTGSVARSDDTASVARSDDATRSEVDADLPMDTLHTAIADHSTDENITPRASGSRSPAEGTIDKTVTSGIGSQFPGAEGQRSSGLLDFSSLPASVEALNFQPIKDNTADTSDAVGNGVVLRPQAVRELLPKYRSLDEQKTKLLPKELRSSDPYHAFGKISSVLEGFDPLLPEKIHAPSDSEGMKCESVPPPLSDSWSHDDSNDSTDRMAMQSLGRLSLAITELPDNGILPTDRSTFATSAPVLVSDDCVGTITDVSSKLNGVVGEDQPIEVSQAILKNSQIKDGLSDATTELGENREPEPHVQHRDVTKFISLDERKMKYDERDLLCAVRLSTGSLTSSVSSSSSGSAGADHAHKSDITSSQETTVTSILSGTIPKSISFDKTAEKGDRDSFLGDDPKHKKSLFKGFKLPFKVRSRKSARNHEELGIPSLALDRAGGGEVFGDDGPLPIPYRDLRRTMSEEPKSGSSEIGDDILAKYRKKPVSMIEGDGLLGGTDVLTPGPLVEKDKDAATACSEDDRQIIDPNNPEVSFAFADAKRKLRLVLSSADVATLPWSASGLPALRSDGDKQRNNELVAFLKMQLAEAINLQDRSLVAQLLETLRCVRLFDKEGSKKLFRSLKDDYKKRSPYIAYLVRCRQGLLTTLSHLERVVNRIERDKVVCNKFMISVCVRLFLEKRERAVQRFVDEFQRLTVSDEKTDLVEQFLHHLYKDMESDPMWQGASEDQIKEAKIAIERNIMSQMYIHALYPNGDGDLMRDKLIFEHIQKLSKVITPNHTYLRIPKIYQYECPWPAAQAEITTINAYKTPRDKLHCVLRCCNTVMNLLNLANEKSVPAADDFIPVLVFVLVRANPPNLLSSIQYVNSFYHKSIEGEDEYWWTQFCSAVEFIKTMDYDE